MLYTVVPKGGVLPIVLLLVALLIFLGFSVASVLWAFEFQVSLLPLMLVSATVYPWTFALRVVALLIF